MTCRLSWTDQPEMLSQGTQYFHGHISDTWVQVIEFRGAWYVTAGNLFGSQTIHVPDVDAVFRCLQLINDRRGDKPLFPDKKIPDGWYLVPNSERDPDPANGNAPVTEEDDDHALL